MWQGYLCILWKLSFSGRLFLGLVTFFYHSSHCSGLLRGKCTLSYCYSGGWLTIGPTHHWSDTTLVRHTIGPTHHWSDTPMVRHTIGPTQHWSDTPLVRHTNDPTHHWSDTPLVRHTNGPTHHWSDTPLVRQTSGDHKYQNPTRMTLNFFYKRSPNGGRFWNHFHFFFFLNVKCPTQFIMTQPGDICLHIWDIFICNIFLWTCMYLLR